MGSRIREFWAWLVGTPLIVGAAWIAGGLLLLLLSHILSRTQAYRSALFLGYGALNFTRSAYL
jgi:hypothetical protein